MLYQEGVTAAPVRCRTDRRRQRPPWEAMACGGLLLSEQGAGRTQGWRVGRVEVTLDVLGTIGAGVDSELCYAVRENESAGAECI
ncbi:hypothetical protein AKJ16_DCAP27146, partial [Drosera capensis]